MFVLPPVFLCQLLDRNGLISWRLLLHFIFVVFLADDLEVDLVLSRDISLLLEQERGVPAVQHHCISNSH